MQRAGDFHATKNRIKFGFLHVDVLLFFPQNPLNLPISQSSRAPISLGPCNWSNDVDRRSQEGPDNIISI